MAATKTNLRTGENHPVRREDLIAASSSCSEFSALDASDDVTNFLSPRVNAVLLPISRRDQLADIVHNGQRRRPWSTELKPV
jgi:hypothetical protein